MRWLTMVALAPGVQGCTTDSCGELPPVRGGDEAQRDAVAAELGAWDATVRSPICVSQVVFRSMDSAPHERGYGQTNQRIHLDESAGPQEVRRELRRALCVGAMHQLGFRRTGALDEADRFADVCELGASGLQPLRLECSQDGSLDPVARDALELYRDLGSRSVSEEVVQALLPGPVDQLLATVAGDGEAVKLRGVSTDQVPFTAWHDLQTGLIREPSVDLGEPEEPPDAIEGWDVLDGQQWPASTLFLGRIQVGSTEANRVILEQGGQLVGLDCRRRDHEVSLEVDGEPWTVWTEGERVKWAPIR